MDCWRGGNGGVDERLSIFDPAGFVRVIALDRTTRGGWLCNRCPDKVAWAGLGKARVSYGRERTSKARVTPMYVHVGRVNNAIAVSFPALPIEARESSTKGSLHGGVGGGADVELACGVCEECGLLRHHDLFGTVKLETVVVDGSQVKLGAY